MLRYLLLGYIILYVFFGVGLFALHAFFVPEEDKKDDPPWETPIDLLLAIVGLAGMVFLFIGFQPDWLQTVWRPVSMLLFVTQVWLNLKDRFSREYANADKESRGFADIFTLLFLAPSLVLNLLYAFH